MQATDSVFKNALSKLLVEIFNGPPGNEAYVLNPGDPGLLRQLESLSATDASTRPMPGKTTIAAHVDHLEYGLSLVNRWAAGDENAWADSDWNASWTRGVVSDAEWRSLRDRLQQQVETWKRTVAAREDWNDMAAAGLISTVAHTAYHLGAIRQILAGLGK